ncbi:hypothetical protein WJX84_008322 [Apatococcus fuscideae]|uniref:Uncharacterized protein n=1 Tax=Apatococcus fuscideae TaxID=2026836 RepID=A0AAW1TEL0_9CHLO
MAQPLRGPTRRTVAVLPPAVKAAYLTDAIGLIEKSCPAMAAYLGRRALEVTAMGETSLPKHAAAGVCFCCGTTLGARQHHSLSATQQRRLRRRKSRPSQKHEQPKKSIGIRKCQACHHVTSQLLSQLPDNLVPV